MTLNISKSKALFENAQQSIPGGVNSPVRAFKSVGGNPIFMESAKGAYMFDADGNKYIDYINSWGPMILGHGHDEVVDALQKQAARALTFGAPTALEIKMAELIKSMVSNVELIRLVSSGTEACMSALRIARGYTGKNKFIKFEGCYHGHADPFLVKAGSGVATFGIQSVPGVTGGASADTLIAPFNDLASVEKHFQDCADEIAAIIIEPVAGNMGCIRASDKFLNGLRALCDKHGAILIFDEVMTGFRLAPGGAQERIGHEADLVTFGKVIGGGMPVGAFGGKREIMESVSPLGNVYQAGTLSGNPLAVIAGLTTLSILKDNPGIYKKLDERSIQLNAGISEILTEKGIQHSINYLGSMISVFFGTEGVTTFEDVAHSNIKQFNRFFHHMLQNGVYLPPSAYESWFLSVALSDGDIDKTLSVVKAFEG